MNLDRYSDNFFQVNHINGFLPKKSPIAVLPKRYSDLQILIDDMPIKKANGENGLLAEEGAIEDAVKNLKNYKELVKDEDDVFINQALFRAYAFLTSAYLLAPSHFGFQKTKKYGKAHTILPSQLAEPFVIVSKKLDVYPFLDYHYAYSLGNYVKIDNAKGYEWENLAMAAKFSGMDDERGFIMLHVDINQYSPQLVGSILEFLNSKNGRNFISTLKNKIIFFDLKLNDIPNTMSSTVIALKDLNINYLTVHISSGLKALKNVKKVSGKTKIAGVTTLTSLDNTDLKSLGHKKSLKEIVIIQAKLATKAKLDALVCSPHEVKTVRKFFKKEIITPGIRFSLKVNDQKRVMTPKAAFKQGSDWLVIGRELTKGNIKNNFKKLSNHLNK